MRLSKKVGLSFASIIVIGALVGGIFLMQKRHTKAVITNKNGTQMSSNTSETKKTEPIKDPTTIKLIATGDWLPHEAINQAAKTSSGYDYMPMLSDMQPLFQQVDIRFCNQSVLGAGTPFGISGYPVFNAPTEFTRDMHKTGCNLVNTGTNHTNDKSQAAINASVSAWDNYSDMLAVAGANRSVAEEKLAHYFSVHGVRFAFLSYTTYTNAKGETSYGLTMWDDALVRTQVAEARKNADIIIVSMRWGTEYSPTINAAQTKYAQTLADLGVDIVLGHGPHVLEPVKILTNTTGHQTIVWFSIANFINAQLETEALFNGIAVMDIDIATKKVLHPRFLPFYMHYEWTADQKAKQDLLARKNFHMYTLDKAVEPLKRSQLQTTVEIQNQRMTNILNSFTEIPIISSEKL